MLQWTSGGDSVSRRLLAANAIWSLVNHLAQRGSLALATILLARSFATRDFATYSYFQMTVNMLATYATMGLAVAASRFFAASRNDDGTGAFPLGTLLCVNVVVAVAAFMILSIAPLGWLTAGRDIPILAISVGVAVCVLDAVIGGAIVGLEAFRSSAIVSIGSAVCLLALTGWAAATRNPTIGMWAIVAAFGLHLAGTTAITVHQTGWERLKASIRWDKQSLHELGSLVGAMFAVSLISGSATWVVGRLIMASAGDKQFAVFTIGMQWLALGLLLPNQMTRVTFSRMVRETHEGLRRLLKWVGTINAAMSLSIAALGFLFASKLILLYGSRYAGDTLVVACFLGVGVINSPANALGNALVGRGRHMSWLIITVVWLLVLLGILLPSSHRSVEWALVAYACAGAVMLMMTIFRVFREA
nr:oligosaccharide flippase family protein [Rhodanobacter sp. DHG33]